MVRTENVGHVDMASGKMDTSFCLLFGNSIYNMDSQYFLSMYDKKWEFYMGKNESVLVGFGGFVGAGLRFGISEVVALPLISTFAVNVIGSFFIGYMFGLTKRHHNKNWLWPLLATGFCGGFTTMSTVSMEVVILLEKKQIIFAAMYLLLTLIIGICAVFSGHATSTRIKQSKEPE